MDWKTILILSLLQIIVSTKGKVILDSSVHECSLRQSSLYCDFENSVIQEVHLEPLNKKIERIYVQHVKKLHLDESVCADVFFYSIAEIVTEGEKNDQCKDGFDLLAMNSSLNKIPKNVKKVSLEFSNITLLATYRSLEELSVKKSNIEVLRIFGPFIDYSKVVLEGSRLKKTEKLILDAGSKFSVKDSTFIKVLEQSILIHPDCERSLENLSGDYKYTNLVTSRAEKMIISTSLQQCFIEDENVYCDFRSSDVNEVFLEAVDTTVKTFFIYNVKKLHLDESICTDVAFYNIQEVLIEGRKSEQCEEGFDLVAMNSFISRIPGNAKTIILANCTISELVTHRSLEKLIVLNSCNGVLNIPEAFGNKSRVMIQGSTISQVEKLILDDGSTFTVKDSVFVNVPEDSILVHPKVKATLENPSDAFNSTDLLIYRENQEKLVMISKEKNISTIAMTVGACVAIVVLVISAVVYKVKYKRISRKLLNKNVDVKGGFTNMIVTKITERERHKEEGEIHEVYYVVDDKEKRTENKDVKVEEDEVEEKEDEE